MDRNYQLFICSIKRFLEGAKDKLKVTADELNGLYRLSYAYDLMQITFPMVDFENLTEEKSYSLLSEGYYQAISRSENLIYELSRIEDVLNAEKIPFIPLKGAVMRNYYTEPFYRTSSDIDILLNKSDLQKAGQALSKKLSFKFKGGTGHDRLYESPSGTDIELHYSLIEEGMAGKSYELLKKAWDHAEKCDGFMYRFKKEFFYLYHVAHMAKHFENGTLGLRPFIDLYYLKNERLAADELIEEAGLKDFDDCVNDLKDVWFNEKPYDGRTKKMESFIFGGGAFGNAETKMSVDTRRAGGKRKYLLKRIFLPYSKLKNYYPNLEKHKWLLPFYEVKRWFRLLNKNKRKVAAKDVSMVNSVSTEKGDELYNFCRELKIGR